MLSIQGKLLYNPIRQGLSRSDQAQTLILDIHSEDLSEYYQWIIKRKYGNWLKLQSPLFGTHVTVVRPQEVNVNNSAWLKYQDEKITIKYSPEELERHWEFWSLTVYSKELVEIRRELNLETNFRLHITIGRQFVWQPKEIISGVNHDSDYLRFEPI